MIEPAFWDFQLKQSREPICTEMVLNYEKLYIELTHFSKMAAHWSFPYFNYSVINPDTGEQTPLYNQGWSTIPVGLIDYEKSVSPEFIDFKKQHEERLELNLDDTIKKMRKRGLPILHSIIWKAERDNILSNAFIGTIEPGCVVNRHKGWGKEYMRVHLALDWNDEDTTITVGDETKTWIDGDILAFRDNGPYFISMKNESKNQERVYLSFDLNIDYLKDYIDIEV